MKPIKIVSYNTYLIANRFNRNLETHPDRRASKICRDFLKSQTFRGKEGAENQTRPELCFFQEGWYSRIIHTVNFGVQL